MNSTGDIHIFVNICGHECNNKKKQRHQYEGEIEI